VYSRLTNGQKGHGNKWEDISVDVLLAELHEHEVITAAPVGVTVTDRDLEAIADKGYSPVLTTKAIAMHDKSKEDGKPEGKTNAIAVFCELYEDVVNRDASLKDLIIDNRRTSGAKIVTPVTHMVEEVQPTTTHNEGNTPMRNHEAPVIHAALATVPRKELATRYVHRKLAGGVEDFEVFDFARSHNINVLIYGPTGPGKTTAVEAWAAQNDLRMATVSGNAALEPGHLLGKFVSDGNGGFAWIDGPVTDVVRNGGVLLLDEFNFISPKIYTALYALLDHHGEVIEAHPDLTIFATMNPDYIGTTPLNFAMRNRFDIQIPWGYDEKVESKLISSKSLLKLATQLRKEADKGAYDTPISTNMLIEFEDIVKGLNYDFAVENFVAHFSLEEQASVRLVMQTHEFNIKEDLGLEVPVVTEAPAEETQPTQTNTDNITVTI
jgi:hypothetical protein